VGFLADEATIFAFEFLVFRHQLIVLLPQLSVLFEGSMRQLTLIRRYCSWFSF
jgi:hypothetical protein